MERLGKVKMNYVKPVALRVDLDKSVCADCMEIQQIFTGSKNLPTGMNIKFNIQCGEGGYDNQRENLHAVIEVQGDGVSEYELEPGGTWATCTVDGWQGKGLCEYQLDNNGGCSYMSPLRVKRNGVWEIVPITWYAFKKQGNKVVSWEVYSGY